MTSWHRDKCRMTLRHDVACGVVVCRSGEGDLLRGTQRRRAECQIFLLRDVKRDRCPAHPPTRRRPSVQFRDIVAYPPTDRHRVGTDAPALPSGRRLPGTPTAHAPRRSWRHGAFPTEVDVGAARRRGMRVIDIRSELYTADWILDADDDEKIVRCAALVDRRIGEQFAVVTLHVKRTSFTRLHPYFISFLHSWA